MNLNTITHIYAFGPPGAGKTTQMEGIFGVDSDNIIDTGAIIRGAVKGEGRFAGYYSLFEPYLADMHGGKLVPDEPIVQTVLQEWLSRFRDYERTFSYTGFPRTVGQLEAVREFEEKLVCVTQRDGTPLQLRTVHIFYNMPLDLAIGRRDSRIAETQTNGGSVRKDDEPGVLERRIGEYVTLTVPMLQVLRRESNLIEIDASKTIEEIREETLGVLHQEVGFLTPEGMRRKWLGELLSASFKELRGIPL